MSTAFDTLKLATRLEAAGLPRQQAVGTSEALAEALSRSDVATKNDLLATENLLRSEIKAFENSLRNEIQTVKNALVVTKTELQGEIELLRSETKLMGRNLLIGLGSLIVAMTGVILGVLPLLLR